MIPCPCEVTGNTQPKDRRDLGNIIWDGLLFAIDSPDTCLDYLVPLSKFVNKLFPRDARR